MKQQNVLSKRSNVDKFLNYKATVYNEASFCFNTKFCFYIKICLDGLKITLPVLFASIATTEMKTICGAKRAYLCNQ